MYSFARVAKVFLAALIVLAGCDSGQVRTVSIPPPNPDFGQHWLRIAHLTDPQLVDEESPARTLRLDGLIGASWRSQEILGVATLDASISVLNSIHSEGKKVGAPVDFAIFTGDLCDLAQWNELRWFIDTLDGGEVFTDTGAADGLTRAPEAADNPKLPYKAEGIAKDIPWYAVVGNHDVLAVGNFRLEDKSGNSVLYTAPLLRPVAAIIGLHDIDRRLNALAPTWAKSPAVVTGMGPPTNAETQQLDLGALRAGNIAPDNDRRFLTMSDFIGEFFTSTSQPVGHGFSEENLVSGVARYVFRPREDIPLRVIVLDTTPPNIPNGYPAFYGVMTEEQFHKFLKPEIEAAKAAGDFVLIASHHPPSDFNLPFPARRVGTGAFRDYLASQPHVVAHLCGHSHRNKTTLVEGKFNYLEIETCAIIDYPQEFRILDLYYDEIAQRVTVASTMASHMSAPTRLSAESFRRAALEANIGQAPIGKQISDALYQSLFKELRPFLDPSEKTDIPRQDQPTIDTRKGRAADRDFIVHLGRAAQPEGQ